MKPLLFGKYCLLERVSVGGMAEVFRAKPFDTPDFRGYLALKRILPHLAEDNEFIKMFIDEAKLTVQLQHPNIVRIYELGQFQKSYYILMEFISGKDVLALQKKMRRARDVIPVEMAMYIASEMARGLHFAHHKRDPDGNPLNIIHRDVSPQNVLVDYRGRVKVIDFGIAKAAVQSTRTQIGVLKGKMGYMSPEQVRGEVLDYRSDVFAIGTVLWEMLTNRRLFHAENEFETMQLVREATAQPPSAKNQFVPPDVDAIVMRALTADPEDRYESAEALADTIDDWLAQNPFGADDLSVWMRTVFADDLDDERDKRESFADIVTPDDVLRIQNESLEAVEEPAVASEPEPVGLTEGSEAADGAWEREDVEDAPDVAEDGIWAGEAPEEGEDIAEFAEQHTMVAAGGFDASEAADDLDLDLDTESEHVEGPADGPAGPITYQAVAAPAAIVGPQHTASEFKSETTNPQLQKPDGDSPPRAFYVIVAICALLLIGGLGAAGAAMMADQQPPPPVGGTISWSIEPPSGLQVKLDEKLVGTTSPHTVDGIAPGDHAIAVSHPDYKPFTGTVTVQAGATSNVKISLDEKEASPGFIALRLPDDTSGLSIFLDGKKQDVGDDNPTFEVSAGPHLIEAVRPGFRPWSVVTSVAPRVRKEEIVALEPASLELTIIADKSSSVRFGSERLGRGTVVAEDIDPTKIHKISVTYRGQGVSTWSSEIGFPEIAGGSIEVDFDKPTPKSFRTRDYGFLQISTGTDWWNIEIDGRPTGLTTPLDVRSKIPVTAGKHRLTFDRAGLSHDFDVEIVKGETLIWRQNVPFEWKPTE